MPIYLYRCDSCGANQETLQKVSDPPLKTCPECGAESMRKLIAPVGVIFKGSGFHKNDYTGGGGSGKKSDSSSSGEGGGDKGDKGGEAKTETKSDSAPATTGGGESSKADKVA